MNSQVEAIIDSCNLGSVQRISSVSGGSINSAYQVETSDETLFLKLNDAKRFPNMFKTEYAGLELLMRSEFHIPKPIDTGQIATTQFLLMEWIEQGSKPANYWRQFGKALAKLHLLGSTGFGLSHDNYIGSLPQSNREHKTWVDFFREERLIPQMKLADKNGLLSTKMKQGFDQLFTQQTEIYPVEKPSLIHGDFWSGNLMISSDGRPSIFDPAVYYGHREMEIAMMALFGGFGDAWLDSYNEIYPLEQGWEERIPIGQLYPLMVHVNLFGGGYGRSVESILQPFCVVLKG